MLRNDELKLYYLYMLSDGEITSNEKKLYNKICKSLDVQPFEKTEVIKECESIEQSDIFSVVKDMIVGKTTSSNFSFNFSFGIFGRSDKEKATILWNLINLGYADSYFSDEEKRIVEFIKDHWNINNDVYQEMIDVAETCLALENHKEWLSDFEESTYKDDGLKQVKKDIKLVLNSIEISLSEIR